MKIYNIIMNNSSKQKTKVSTERKVVTLTLSLALICTALFVVQDKFGAIDQNHFIFSIVALVLLTLFVIYAIRSVMNHN